MSSATCCPTHLLSARLRARSTSRPTSQLLLVRAMRQSDMVDLEMDGFFQAQELIELCQKFDFKHIGSSLASQLGEYAEIVPAQVFTIASYYNNIALASYVLVKAHDQIFREHDDDFDLSQLDGCSKPYLLALMQCFHSYSRVLSQNGTSSVSQKEGIWRTCVAKFNPDVSAHSC